MREVKLGVAVGKKGVGKTYTTNIMLQQYIKGNPAAGVKPRRALILDVNDEYEEIRALRIADVMKFSVHQNIEARRIRPFHDDGRRMTSNEIADTLFLILNTYRGGLLLIEDINRYISDYLPNDLVGAICTNRHTDTDIIMHFQSIGRITTKIWQNINWLRFHKNTDSVDRHQQKFQDKYELFKIVELMVNKQYYAGNNRFYVFVDVDEEKILGNYTRQMFEDAMQEYIDFAYRKIISPLLAEKTMEGKKKHTPQSAMEFVKNRIRANYLKKK